VTFATDSPTAHGDVYVALSDGTRFVDQNGVASSSTKGHDWFAIDPNEEIRIGDRNGDRKADFFTFLPPARGCSAAAIGSPAPPCCTRAHRVSPPTAVRRMRPG
jgi:hypothetical protein